MLKETSWRLSSFLAMLLLLCGTLAAAASSSRAISLSLLGSHGSNVPPEDVIMATTTTTTATTRAAFIVQRMMKEKEEKEEVVSLVSSSLQMRRLEAHFRRSLLSSLNKADKMTTSLRQRQLQDFNENNNNVDVGGDASSLGNEEEYDAACDAGFMDCLQFDGCVSCYTEMGTKEIDWASVKASTICNPTVLNILYAGSHCMSLQKDAASAAQFCKTYQACIRSQELNPSDANDDANGNPDGNGNNKKPNIVPLDCTTLRECKWNGIHEQFIGDGICHEAVEGCYNSAICGYDGGDCCEDTCKERPGSYVKCGAEPYACRAPNSKFCDPKLNVNCQSLSPDSGSGGKNVTVCANGSSPYRLIMYDSFGDGWDSTSLKLMQQKDDAVVFYGKLENGFQDYIDICLSSTPTCYRVEVSGGVWGKEVSWEVKSGYNNAAAPAIAGGGAPMSCNFGILGFDPTSCPTTCSGRPNVNPADDAEYKEFKDLTICIHDSCPIQVGICENDEICMQCFQDSPQEYCYSIDAFNNLVDCTLCQCTDNKGSKFCQSKLNPGVIPVTPTDNQDQQGHSGGSTPCSPARVIKGGDAILKFGSCTDFDKISMLVTEFDQNNFGDLDKFESCAHSYQTRKNHGGETALGCLRILVNAMQVDPSIKPNPDTPVEAIAALAGLLYNQPESFCKCTEEVNNDATPLCPSFHNFKTLLFETLDACTSLDEIDCDAWAEFYPPCQTNFQAKYSSTGFSTDEATVKEQCSYIHEQHCGGDEPFPVFRRLDCEGEISDDAWRFYQDYSMVCLNTNIAPTPAVAPTSAAVPTPAVVPTPGSAPTKPYVPPPDNRTPYSPPDNKKPYIPPEERGKPTPSSSSSATGSDTPKKKSHWFRNLFWLLLLGGLGYYCYQQHRRVDSFNINRYRHMASLRGRTGNFFRGGGPGGSMSDDMYSGLVMDSSTTFEPPSLPPPPSTFT